MYTIDYWGPIGFDRFAWSESERHSRPKGEAQGWAELILVPPIGNVQRRLAAPTGPIGSDRIH